MRNLVLYVGLAMFAAIPAVSSLQANDDDEPKYEIDQVMKEGMKGGLLRKVASGQASDEEKQKMIDMVESLPHYEVQKGDQEAWKMKTEALIKAVKGVVEGDDEAAAALRMASNCMACHRDHKP